MKKAFTLIEVIISVVILSVVIISLLSIKEQNLFILNKLKQNVSINSFISLAAYSTINQFDKNETIRVSSLVDFEDDEIRKYLKDLKIIVKDKKENIQKLDNDVSNISIVEYSNIFTIDNNRKIFFTFKFE